MKSKFLRLAIGILLISTLSSGCFHFEQSHSGVVIDKSTNTPISNVTVLEGLSYRCFLPISPAGSDMEDLGQLEAVTGADGKYTLGPKFYWLPPLLCSVTSNFTYTHPDYATGGYHQGFPWDIPAPEFVTVALTHKTADSGTRSCTASEILGSVGYMFIRCGEGDSAWLAVPPMKLAIGETIYYQDIKPLINFPAKAVNRTFKEIRFPAGVSR